MDGPKPIGGRNRLHTMSRLPDSWPLALDIVHTQIDFADALRNCGINDQASLTELECLERKALHTLGRLENMRDRLR